ncbi:MAG: hypothetical protein HQK50_19205, partial [Oligoflexia bacterium]|nr:hypothetical protein [Oligoflexia bacterium]
MKCIHYYYSLKKSLKLSQPAKLTLYTVFASKVDTSRVHVYFYNETTKAFERIGGALAEDQKSIVVDITHFSTYAVLYSDLPVEETTSATTTEETITE